jgi:hypothetical protein
MHNLISTPWRRYGKASIYGQIAIEQEINPYDGNLKLNLQLFADYLMPNK